MHRFYHRFLQGTTWLARLRLHAACLAVLQHWSLFKKLWPFGGMYTTMAALTTDKEGRYVSVWADKSFLGESSRDFIFPMNFSS